MKERIREPARPVALGDGEARTVARADEMYAGVYQDLKRIAHYHLRRVNTNTLCTTELIHEAFLRIGGSTSFEGRAHFFGTASRAMRQVLVDFARRRQAKKRAGANLDVSFVDAHGGLEVRLDELIALDDALQRLHSIDPRLGELVELRFFGGLPASEVAELRGVSTRTVERDWMKARLFLLRELESA